MSEIFKRPTKPVLCNYCNNLHPMRLVEGSNGEWIGIYCTDCGGPHTLPVVGKKH